MIKEYTKGKLCQYLITFILCGLLIPSSVSAQCGDCDDGNPCTKDFCNGTKCEHTPQSCFEDSFMEYEDSGETFNGSMRRNASGYNATMGVQFQGTGEVQTPAPIICEDYNLCTIDYSGPAGCTHDPVSCDDGNPLTTDYCTATGCINDPVNCDDGNPCTSDYSSLAGCMHDPVSCDDSNPCTTDSCGAMGCVNDPVNCDDASEDVRSYCGCPSQPDRFDAGFLTPQNETLSAIQPNLENYADGNATQEENFTQEGNESGSLEMDVNTKDEGNETEIISLSPICDCINDSAQECCSSVGSNGNETSENSSAADGHLMVASNYTQASDCDDGDPCTDDHFVNGKCMHYTKTCNDNIPSNFDYCYQGDCVHSPINCDDGDKCTIDSYNGTACVHSPRNCDDGNPCTEDSCNKLAGCQNMEINHDNNYCTVECENGNPVFKPLICDDGNPWTKDYCDKSRGCVHVPICGPYRHYCNPYSHHLPADYHYPYLDFYYPVNYYPYRVAPIVSAPKVAVPSAAISKAAATSAATPQTKSYNISAGTVITLPWNHTVTALDALQVENGVALSSGSGIRFSRQMGMSKVYQLPDSQNIFDRAEMVGLSWPANSSPFTLTLIQPNGTTLSVQDGDENALHLTGSNYNYYFLRNPAEGYWTVVVTPTQTAPNGTGFSLISGLVKGIVPPNKS